MQHPRRLRPPGRRPLHPGRFLDSHFLRPSGLSQDALANALGISRRRVNELVRGRRGITPDTALRLATYFKIEPSLWTGLQSAWDLHQAWLRFDSRSDLSESA